MKIRFKLIPFLMSLLIVGGATFGICWYSYHDYDLNKVAFYNHYFHLDDHEDYQTTDLLANYVKFHSNYYQRITSDELTYRDPNTKINYTENKHTSMDEVANLDAYYQNGVLHFPGYFSVEVYAIATETQGEWNYSYYFLFYNINYKNGDYDPNKLRIVFVNGIGEGSSADSTDDTDDEYGDALLDTALDRIKKQESGGASQSAPYYWSFLSNNYPVFDNGFTNDEGRDEDSGHYVYNIAPRQDLDNHNIQDKDYYPTGEITFSIYYDLGTTDGEANIEEIVQGTLSNIQSPDDFVERTTLSKGYEKNPYLANYKGFIWKKILLHGSITFVLAGIIAFLFYLVWMDEPKKDTKVTNTKYSKNKAPNTKKKKK